MSLLIQKCLNDAPFVYYIKFGNSLLNDVPFRWIVA